MKKFPTLENKILIRISRSKSNIFLRKDFENLGGYDQVGRVLLQLTRKGTLIKIGYGLYAKTKVSTLTGARLPAAPLPSLAKDALKRLGVKVGPTRAELDYQAGHSTQVPTGRLIGVKKRISRKIGFKDVTIHYELVSR